MPVTRRGTKTVKKVVVLSGPNRTVRLGKRKTGPSLPKTISFKAFADTAFPKAGKIVKLGYASFGEYAMPNNNAYQLRLNSCFDVDLTNTGHQPQHLDDFCKNGGPYNMYNVKSAIMKVTLVNGPTTGFWLAGGIWTDNATVASGTLNAYRENGGPMKWCPSNGYSSSGSITIRVPNVAKLFGLDQYDDTLTALYNANPNSVLYCFFGAFDPSGALLTASLPRINLEIQQVIKFSNKAFADQD